MPLAHGTGLAASPTAASPAATCLGHAVNTRQHAHTVLSMLMPQLSLNSLME